MELAATIPCWGRGGVELGVYWRRNARVRLRRRVTVHCSSSIPDSRNKTWSDVSLAKELREFMSANGLPSDKVPTMKELASNGRQDLANVVRRRGYKAISQLLASTPFASQPVSVDNVEKEGISQTEKKVVMNGSARVEEEFSANRSGFHQLEYLDSLRPTLSETSKKTESTADLEAKAIHFLDTGQLIGKDESAIETEYSSGEEEEEPLDASELEDETSEVVALKKAALLRSKLLPFINARKNASPEEEASANFPTVNSKINELPEKDKDLQSQSKAEVPDDAEDSKAALQAREKELATLARELDEAKAQLALVQAKATAELAQAKQVSIEKDMRLSVAEHALANLKQVKIEWWGAASKVELAGSFNGWQHFFVLEPDLSSEISRPDGTRGPLMWETQLWLYPGVYEMKFIVDGDWQIDHRREVSMKDMNQNNILRVEP